MNQRIRELAEQATKVVSERVWDENNGMYYSDNRSRLDPEKFAELIVQDCLDIIDHEGCGEGGSICAIKSIKQHFGVEE